MAKSREMACGEIFADAERHECAFSQTVLRHERGAGAYSCGDVAATELATAEPHRAPAVLRTVDGAQQARGARADQTGDAEISPSATVRSTPFKGPVHTSSTSSSGGPAAAPPGPERLTRRYGRRSGGSALRRRVRRSTGRRRPRRRGAPRSSRPSRGPRQAGGRRRESSGRPPRTGAEHRVDDRPPALRGGRWARRARGRRHVFRRVPGQLGRSRRAFGPRPSTCERHARRHLHPETLEYRRGLPVELAPIDPPGATGIRKPTNTFSATLRCSNSPRSW